MRRDFGFFGHLLENILLTSTQNVSLGFAAWLCQECLMFNVKNVIHHHILELLAGLETQRGRYNAVGGKLTESEVAEHRTDVLILVITTKLLELDHTLGQLAVLTLLAGHIGGFTLRHNS